MANRSVLLNLSFITWMIFSSLAPDGRKLSTRNFAWEPLIVACVACKRYWNFWSTIRLGSLAICWNYAQNSIQPDISYYIYLVQVWEVIRNQACLPEFMIFSSASHHHYFTVFQASSWNYKTSHLLSTSFWSTFVLSSSRYTSVSNWFSSLLPSSKLANRALTLADLSLH